MPPRVAPHQAPPRPLSLHDAARAGEERSVKQLVDELPHPSAVDDQDELNRETAHVSSPATKDVGTEVQKTRTN